MRFFVYFVAKFAQAGGLGWMILGLYAGLIKGSLKWEWILFFFGLFLFGLGYLLERVLLGNKQR
jgi:hypothetical protein